MRLYTVEKSVFRIWNPATPMMHGMEQRWLRNIEQKEDATILSMKLRLGESRIVVVEQEKETVSQLEKSLFEMMYGVEKEKIPVKKNWEIGTCRSIAYPKFSNFQPITKFEDYGKKEKKFSGFIAYRNQMERMTSELKWQLRWNGNVERIKENRHRLGFIVR